MTDLQLRQFGSPTLWLEQNLPCLGENINIAVQLGFLGIFLLQLLVKKFSSTQKDRVGLADRASSDNFTCRVSLNISCKLCIVCSVALILTHIVVILTLLDGQVTCCAHKARSFSSETLHVLSCAVSALGVYKSANNRFIKFPWLLRTWWIWSFILSVIFVALDTHLRIKNHFKFRLRDYGDFFGLFVSTCLFGVSIRGKTGLMVLNDPNGIGAPLISGKNTDNKRESSYGKANLLELITFSWLNPLFAVGFNKPLEQDEISCVDTRDSAEFLLSAFDESQEYVKEKEGPTTNPSIYSTIYYFIRKKAAINACFAVITASASYVGPYLINDFVTFLSEKKNRSLKSGYFLALAFLGAKMVETTAQRQWIFGARQLGLRLRAALISQIYRKGLTLSSQSRQSHTSGEMINYMSVDIQRITDFIWYMNIIWMLPVQISLAMYILHRNIGFGSLAAFLGTLIVMSLNIPLTRIQKSYQAKIMEAKDCRMKATSEVLRNMKILKLQAWDIQFLSKLECLRKVEYNWLFKSLRLSALTAFVFWGSPTFISVATFGSCVVMGIELTAGRVLAALATFRMLQDPIFNLPDLLNVIAQGKVSVDRLACFLRNEELQNDAIKYIERHETEFDIIVRNGKFRWDSNTGSPSLSGINLRVRRGMKVAICGTVGSGKSSLVSSILGEMQKLSGTVEVSGTKAYVPQTPWILTGNIRDNILFGNRYDKDRYERTVKACALVKDFELFSCGDLTEIGERGINMSGGQKQRIQIARAVYQDADIYLLDDPFSAVDAHTGTQLFQDCLMGILREKTIIFVTHQVEFLPAADLILVMQNGKIAQAGTFGELLKENIGFEILVGAHNQALDSILKFPQTSRAPQQVQPDDAEPDTVPTTNSDNLHARQESDNNISLEISEKAGKLVQDEEREKGSIGREIYCAYLTMVRGGLLVPIIILAQSSFQVLQIASNYWIAWACPPTKGSNPKVGMKQIISVYALLAVAGSLCVLLRASLVGITGLWTAEKLFMNMLRSVLRAPMSFFDSTPAGRILSRASTDQSVVDMEMPQKLGWCAFSIIQILGTIAVMSQVAWEVFAIFIPVTAVCVWYQRYYTPTARELARLEGIKRTPILHHFSESLSGASTIRAFQQQGRFINANLCLIDNHSTPWFHNVAAMEWLSFRLNVLSNFVFAFSLVLLVTLPEGIINPSIAGLAVTYGINLNVLQASVIWNLCNAENKMISVERIIQYSKIQSEEPLLIEDSKLPNNWPAIGTVCFKNLQIRYAEHLPYVLKNIDCTFPGGKKIGVVGRTGSGKSTLIQAIFRIVEPGEGRIIIDGVDISRIGLHDLRSRLSIIPQDPTMFEGTVRGNLDPLEQYSDSQAWEVLEKCQLASLVCSKDDKLDASVVENGENWSVGQRQLFCLGRALLKKSSILVLDEATASVDSATDGVIQKIISKEFKHRTVVTIAHRIHTVIDSDMALVLSDGRIAEYDTPTRLLEREDSFFSKLVKEYNMRSKSFNTLTA